MITNKLKLLEGYNHVMDQQLDLISRIRQIECILRNGLPNDDRAKASTISHAHSEIEKVLEDVESAWWMQ